MAHDISNEHRTAAPENDDRLRLLLDSVVDYGIFMLDLHGRVTSWNAGAERLKGYSAREIIGQHFSVFYPRPPDAARRCEEELALATRDGRFEDEGWRVRKDGSRFWANVVITAVRDSAGALIGFGKVTRDLTERQLAGEELRRSEERLRLLIASVKDYAIFILDPEGRVATWNPGAERLKGYAFSEIVGKHFSCFYPEEDVRAGKCEHELHEAKRLGRFEDEGWRIRKDGSRFWANVVITPIRNAKDELLGFAKVTRDLSERKAYEEERVRLARAEEARHAAEENQAQMLALTENLRAARDKAEQATRLKDEFLATVSHELRTPLSAILGWGRMLQGGTMPPEKVSHANDAIVRNAIAQTQIIDDLLDVSRIVAGQLRLDVDLIDINEVVSAAIDVVRPAADAKGVTMRAVLSPDTGIIRGDAGRLQQVLWNLLTNAVKFTSRGGSVQITVQRAQSGVQVDVSDTGKGISPDFLPRIFDRFSQQESSNSRRTGGLGLGLAIVKHLIELHGGTVEAHSAGEGQGASFTISIPLAPTAAAKSEPPMSSAAPDVLRITTQLTGIKVLVLDDDLDTREVMQELLERAHVTTLVASNAEEALALVRSERPDVIVSDIGMAGEDGYVFARKLRALPREEGGRTPAVALTAYACAEDRRRALLAGFQNHATKPIDPQELLLVIASLAERLA